MSEWIKRDLEFPNPAANCAQVFIQFSDQMGASYYPVEGGFKLDRDRANAKLYTSESEIRSHLLKTLLRHVQHLEREISGALAAVKEPANQGEI